MHHPGKVETRVDLAARGSTALLGHVDISIDMRWRPGGVPVTSSHNVLAAGPGSLAERSARKEALGRAILTGGRGIPRIAVSGWRRSASDRSPPATSWRQT